VSANSDCSISDNKNLVTMNFKCSTLHKLCGYDLLQQPCRNILRKCNDTNHDYLSNSTQSLPVPVYKYIILWNQARVAILSQFATP